MSDAPRISAHALTARDRCRRLFALQYGERLYWPGPVREPGPEAARGEAFHRLVQRHRLGLAPEVPPDLADLWARFLASPYADPAGTGGETGRVWTEQVLQTALEGVPFTVRYDELRLEGEDWTILDWKTGPRREAELAASWQTRLYRFVLARAGRSLLAGDRPPGAPYVPVAAPPPERIRLVYWLVAEERPVAFPYGTFDFAADKELFREVALAAKQPLAALAGPDDPDACSACRFESYCHPRARPAPVSPPLALPRFDP